MDQAKLASLVIQHRMSETAAAVGYIWWRSRHAGDTEVPSGDIKTFFVSEGISQPNISRLKQRLNADRRLMKGVSANSFRLRAAAFQQQDELFGYVKQEVGTSATQPVVPLMLALEKHAGLLPGSETREFVLEAITSAKNGCRRAAIIMAWSGAVSVLQEYVFDHHLQPFNDDALANNILKKQATTLSDLRDLSKESQFIESLFRISVIDGSQKKALKRCLDLRNDCGHPSQLKLGDAAVASHIEALLFNVFDPFGSKLAAAA